jgi:hypothetical protein
MPQLLIQNVGGDWEALIANTNQAVAFEGGSAAEQAESVKALAEAMADGWEAVSEAVLTVFKGVPNGVEGSTIAESIFGTVDSLAFGNSVYVAETTLMADIEAVGEWLLALV